MSLKHHVGTVVKSRIMPFKLILLEQIMMYLRYSLSLLNTITEPTDLTFQPTWTLKVEFSINLVSLAAAQYSLLYQLWLQLLAYLVRNRSVNFSRYLNLHSGSSNSWLVEKFAKAFHGMSLPAVLAEFSLPTPLGEHRDVLGLQQQQVRDLNIRNTEEAV